MPTTEVKATRPGIYAGRMRLPGDVFAIADDSMLGSWMEPVAADDRARLAVRMAELAKVRKNAPAPGKDVPITTALIKGGPLEPSAPPKAEKPAAGEKPVAHEKPPKADKPAAGEKP